MPAARTGPDRPNWALVDALFASGCRFVAGLDEVGRGAWAGPVAVGVAVCSPEARPGLPAGVRDSKLLTPRAREALFGPVSAWCAAFAVGEASPAECDELGMTAAQALAARRALARLGCEPDAIVVDGRHEYTGHRAARAVVGADETCTIVSAASILAKVTRDRTMVGHDAAFPDYGFSRNKGYASKEHRLAVARLGLTPLHRRSFAVRLPAEA